MKSKYSDTYFAFHYAVNHQITQSGFRLWFWPLTPGAFMSDKLRQLARGVIYGESEKVWKLSTTDTTHWHVSARLYIAQHWVQCSHSWLAAFQPTTPVFPSTLALNMEDAYTVLCDIRARNKVFRRACSKSSFSTIRLKLQARYDRARAVKRSFLPILQQTQAHKSRGRSQSCLRVRLCQVWRIEGLQAKLRELTGGVYDFEESDESDSDDQLSDC